MCQSMNDSIVNLKLAKIMYGGVQTRGWTGLTLQYSREEAHSERVLGRSMYLHKCSKSREPSKSTRKGKLSRDCPGHIGLGEPSRR